MATLLPPTAESGHLIGMPPTRVRIPAIDVDAPVVPIGWEVVSIDGPSSQSGLGSQAMWQVPDWHAAGWHETSAKLGVPGNTVLNGHNTTNGEVFRDLYKLEPGALILMDGENGETYTYHVQYVYILPEAGQPMEIRVQNARYIQPTDDERLTLVTCHPYGSLRNRLVVIAFPVPVS
jgi:sortase A